MSAQKKKKLNEQPSTKINNPCQKVYEKLISAGNKTSEHELSSILHAYRSFKHPILHVLQSQNDIYKTNPDKKKKPIEVYLDTVNTLYRKKDLDILINPLYIESVFEKWAPREIAIFQQSIIKFGKQFQFISELIGTKTPKDVYQFYTEWKTSTHYKSYRASNVAANRTNYEDWI